MIFTNNARHRGKVTVHWLYFLPMFMVAFLVTAFVTPVLNASAALYDQKYEYEVPSGRPNYGALYAIQYNKADSYPAWCIQSGTTQPGADEILTPSTITAPSVKAPAELALTTAQTAYLLKKVGTSMDETTEAAVSYLVHANFEIPSAVHPDAQAVVNLMVTDVKGKYPQVHARAVELARDARTSAVVGYEKSTHQGENKRVGKINNIGVKNAGGQWVTGIKVTLKLEGPAVFDATGTNTWTGVTKSEPVSLTWTATGNGKVKPIPTYYSPHRRTLTKYDANGIVQDILSYGGRPGGYDPEELVLEGGSFNVVYDFQPVAVSNVGDAKVAADGVLKDTITVKADPNYGNGDWMKIDGVPVPVVFEGTAYWVGEELPVTTAGVPAGAEKIGSVKVTAAGAGDYTAVLDEKSSKPGFVTWVWRVVKADQSHVFAGKPVSEYVHADWADQFGLADETSSVPFEVEVDSSAVSRVSKAGTHLGDDLWVKGLPTNHGEFKGGNGFNADVTKLNQHLYFFDDELEVSDENKVKAELIGSVTVPAKNGYYSATGLEKFMTKKNGHPGTYVFVTEFPGSDRVKPFTSSVTDKTEQFVVEHPEPKLETTATHKEDDSKEIPNHDVVEISDKVCYDGLFAGKKYTITGVLMDKDTNRPVMDNGMTVTATKEFTAQGAKGCETLVFAVNAESLKSAKTVVFEGLYYKGKKIGAHADINDEGQTVEKTVPKLKTTATDKKDGDKIIPAAKDVEVVDKVCYENLRPGKEYTITGVLMDKETNKPLIENGKQVTSTKKFTATESKGCEDVVFKVNGSTLHGKSIVVFEDLYYKGKKIGAHADINDEGQTVRFPVDQSKDKAKRLPKTGIATGVALASVLTGGAGVAMLSRRNRYVKKH